MTTRVWTTIVPLALLASGCGVIHATSASPVHHAKRSHYPIVDANMTAIHLAGNLTLAVPQSDMSETGPVVVVLPTPSGILWMTPPGFQRPTAKLSDQWHLWFTRWLGSRGGSLWTGAKLLTTYPKTSQFSILGQTGPDVVLAQTNRGTTLPVIVNRQSLNASTLDQPITHVGAVEDHVLVYQSHNRAVVDNLKSHQIESHALGAGAAEATWTLVPHGLEVGSTLLAFSNVPVVPKPALPNGWKWLDIVNHEPIMAVPARWTVQKINPGGSSWQYQVTNPSSPKEQVSISFNACYGCSEPNAGLGVNSIDTAGAGPDVISLNDHASLSHPSIKQGMTSQTVDLVWPNGGSGDILVSWTLSQSQRSLGKTLIRTLLEAWRNDTAAFTLSPP